MLDLTAQYLAGLPQAEPVDAVIRECHARIALETLASGETEIGVIRFRSEYRDYFDEQTSARGLSFELLSKYHYLVTLNQSHPLAGRKSVMRAELDGLPEIVHGDMFRVQGKPEELVRRKIYCVDRLAQMTLLEKIPNSYMLAPGHPGALHPALESRAAALQRQPEPLPQRAGISQTICNERNRGRICSVCPGSQGVCLTLQAGSSWIFHIKKHIPCRKKHWYFFIRYRYNFIVTDKIISVYFVRIRNQFCIGGLCVMSKITVIGAGSVGSTIANDLMIQGTASEIVLIDVNKQKAFGEAMDIYQGAPFCSPDDRPLRRL